MKEPNNQKLIVLGFDGATPSLLLKWVEEGELPNLKRIMETGAFGSLRSVPNMSSPAAWSTFATGKNPGKHGIYRFTERKSDSYGYRYVNAAFRQAVTFWEILCAKDATRVGCVINVPMTYPSEEINGCMISGFDAPGADSAGVCTPSSLIQELRANCGSYEITRDFADLLRKGDNWGQVADHMLVTMEMRYKCMLYLMNKYDWSIFTIVFGETDHAQHFYWKFMDENHPDFNMQEAQTYGDTVLRIYKKMDEICGRIVENNKTANIIIVSDHGGGINTRGGSLVADWLERLGYLKMASGERSLINGTISRIVRNLANKGYRQANSRLSTKTKLRLIRFLPGLRESVESAVRLGGIDWTKTKAYCDGVQDDIWINLSGRDPLGVVSKDEYDQICDYLVSELKDTVDVNTGLPIVESVFRRNEKYQGNFVNRSADITFNWKPEAVINGIESQHARPVREPKNWDWPVDLPTGGHSMDGIFLATGPLVKNKVVVNEAQLMDIAPTILYFFDKEIPQDMDGKVLTEIFVPDYIEANPPRSSAKMGQLKEEQEDIYSEEDSSVIEQRLKDLGYI